MLWVIVFLLQDNWEDEEEEEEKKDEEKVAKPQPSTKLKPKKSLQAKLDEKEVSFFLVLPLTFVNINFLHLGR